MRESELYEESHNAYLEALRVFPGNDNLLNDFARLLILKKEYTKAEAILKKLVSKDQNNKIAKQNLTSLHNLLNKQIVQSNNYEASRPLAPLRSAFNPSEVKASKENLIKISKAKLDKKLNTLPELPHIDKEMLAEEWISAGKDSLRSKYPELTLKFCGYALKNNGNTCQVYGLAGDAYMSIKQYTNAHLCYLIAAECGELDGSQQINLLSLAAIMGDSNILTHRKTKLGTRGREQSKPHKNVDKIMTSIADDTYTIFDPGKGIIASNELSMKQEDLKEN